MSSLTLLLSGFFRLLLEQQKLYIPKDVILMIHKYCTFGLGVNWYLLAVRNGTYNGHGDIKLFNIFTMNHKYMTFNEIQITHSDDFYHQFSRMNESKCIIKDISLPIPFKTKLSELYPSYNEINNKWSMLAFIGGYKSQIANIATNTCHLCAFPSNQLYSANKYQSFFKGCKFSFPSLPQPMVGLTTVYNQYNHILYASNSKSHRTAIFSSNLNAETVDGMKWKLVTDNLISMRYDTTSCIVDKGQFIAILGGKGALKKVELYAINANRSILLSNMNTERRKNESSIYNAKLHKIIVGGCKTFEFYDINKDEWLIFYKRYSNFINDKYESNIWISEMNPNIIFFSGYKDVSMKKTEKQDINLVIERLDLRQCNNGKEMQILSLNDINNDDCSVNDKNEILRLSKETISPNRYKSSIYFSL